MMIDWLPNLLLAWGVQLTGVASPGPSVALILGVATAQGRPPALSICFGIGFASIVLGLATVLGLAAIWSQAAYVMTAIKFAGAAYLSWLAYSAFRKAIDPPLAPNANQQASAGRAGMRNYSIQGFLMQLMNPKAMIFWVAIAALSNLNEAPVPVVIVFLFGAFCVSFVGHSAWALALSSKPFRSLYGRSRRWVEGTLGMFFAFAAFKLATART